MTLEGMERFELSTNSLTGYCSDQLSYIPEYCRYICRYICNISYQKSLFMMNPTN